jgi:hypothetical protein
MKTKTLLIAAAALVAGVISSEAQTVYSVNVAGYVNVAAVAAQFALVNNPLDNGTNTVTSLFSSAPNGTVVEVWNGTGFQSSTKGFGGVWTTNLFLPPGIGYFVKFASNATNTFVGNVIAPSGGSVTNTFNSGIFQLVGSPIPFADTLSGTNLNLQVPNGTVVEVWNGVGFQSATKGFGGVWTTNLIIAPGQGFFVKSGATTNWIQTLQQ